jgi:hypothetical protein
MGIIPDYKTSFCQKNDSFESAFYNHVLKSTFEDGESWPNLKSITLCGINLVGFEEEAGETFQSFTDRALSGATVQEISGDYTSSSTRKGTIMNQYGTDGLKPQFSYGHEDELGEDFGHDFDVLGLLLWYSGCL